MEVVKRSAPLLLVVVIAAAGSACGGTMIEPGHRGLVFDASRGGLQREIVAPGLYRGPGRIDDFDVTYSTAHEPLSVITSEALFIDVRVSVIYRPIIAELYQLDTEIGPRYYDEVVGPEFRSAARAVFARHSYVDLPKSNEALEDEIEGELRRRVNGRHVEIASVTFESVRLPPQLAAAVTARVVAREKAEKERIEAEAAWQKEKTELERNVVRQRLEREAREAAGQTGASPRAERPQ
jgi:regulator of protease activity HflC (stomatin/prohibitin superfamily)